MTWRETPVARDTADMPPRPQALLSAATNSRRERSSRTFFNRATRVLTAAPASIPSRIAQNNLKWKCYFLTNSKRLFPELQPLSARRIINGESKLTVNLEEIRPDCVTPHGRAGNVVLLRRQPGGRSSLEEVGLAEAYQDWLTGCAASEHEAPDYEHFVTSMLRDRAYRLHFGDDIDAALDLIEPLFE